VKSQNTKPPILALGQTMLMNRPTLENFAKAQYRRKVTKHQKQRWEGFFSHGNLSNNFSQTTSAKNNPRKPINRGDRLRRKEGIGGGAFF
jgi:hypothetical protein